MYRVIGSAAEMERDKSNSTMTAYLKVDYKAPIRTPGVVLVSVAFLFLSSLGWGSTCIFGVLLSKLGRFGDCDCVRYD